MGSTWYDPTSALIQQNFFSDTACEKEVISFVPINFLGAIDENDGTFCYVYNNFTAVHKVVVSCSEQEVLFQWVACDALPATDLVDIEAQSGGLCNSCESANPKTAAGKLDWPGVIICRFQASMLAIIRFGRM